jgi:hypothetical protein
MEIEPPSKPETGNDNFSPDCCVQERGHHALGAAVLRQRPTETLDFATVCIDRASTRPTERIVTVTFEAQKTL